MHRTHTAGSADVKVQNILHVRNNITCSTDCKYTTAVTLYNLEVWLFSGVFLNTLHISECDNKGYNNNNNNNNNNNLFFGVAEERD